MSLDILGTVTVDLFRVFRIWLQRIRFSDPLIFLNPFIICNKAYGEFIMETFLF